MSNNNTKFKTNQEVSKKFSPFHSNKRVELENLKKKLRQNRDDKTSRDSVPHSGQDELHFNTQTNKMDNNLTRDQIESRIKELESDQDKPSKKTYKISERYVKSFENFMSDRSMKCNCGCVECICGKSDETMSTDMGSKDGQVSYMFFNNLETIKKMSKAILSMDHGSIDNLLNQGHNWAEDHISVTKENISHVHNFIMNESDGVMESHNIGTDNYMFFANLETIHRNCNEILSVDSDKVDNILKSGHDWAEDHLSSAKENIHQVYDWLENEL